jgi:predicted RNA binding protein YcfA (HicA-like mRNA interferase family)
LSLSIEMPRVPVLKPREVVAILVALDFSCVRQRGSHMQFRHADGRATTVPDHGGRDISPSLLRKIARDIGMTADEFVAHR